MSNKKITYAPIVPLIGGEPLGVMEALDGQLPEYVLSYSPFGNNDSHYINHLREKKDWKGEYVIIDDEQFQNYVPKQVDVVMSTCPCAGLSSLSTTSSADSAVNDWMYTTAEYVLDKVKPKVFWGENAPRLFSSSGKPVADKLFEIGKKYGYSMNLYFTESRLHGLSQKRARTFYFFTKSEKSPIFKYFNVPFTPVEKVLKAKTLKSDPMNIHTNPADPIENAWVAYAIHKTGAADVKDLFNKVDSSTNLIVKADRGFGENLNEVADWMDAQDKPEFSKIANRARSMQDKLDDNKGYWAHGVTIAKGVIPSLIGAMPHALINPITGKYLTIRDCLRIMSMPDDFNLVGDSPRSKINHICQNVPVSTARDMMFNVVDFLNGSCDFVNGSYVKQNNKKQDYEILDNERTFQSLGEFF